MAILIFFDRSRAVPVDPAGLIGQITRSGSSWMTRVRGMLFYFPRYSRFFQVLADRDLLRAFLLALPAFFEERRIMGGSIEITAEEHCIDLPGQLRIVVHVSPVILLETLGDADTLRAIRVVPAPGAGDHRPVFEFTSDLFTKGRSLLPIPHRSSHPARLFI